MVAALALPVLVLLLAIVVPLGWVSAPELVGLARNPIVRLVLFGISTAAFFHAAHRLRFVIQHGLRLHNGHAALAVACYGAALVGTVAAGAVLI
jgi:fumarate reductase subunit D